MTQRHDNHRPLSRPTSSSLAAVSLLVALAAAGCDPEPGADTVSPSELRSLATTFPVYDIDTDPTSGRRLNTNALGDLEFSNIDYGPGPAHDQSLKLVAIDLGDFVPHMPWEQGELWAADAVDLTTLGLDAHMLTAQNIAGEQLRHSDFHGSRWTVRVEMEVIDEWQNQGQGVAYTLVEDNGELYGLVELVLTVGWSTLPEGADGPTNGDEDSQELAYAAAGAIPLYTFLFEKDGRNGDDEIGLFETCSVPEGGYHTTTAVLYQDLFVHDENGVVKPTSDSLYIGCVAGAVGKVATWGYWPDALPDLGRFEAAVRMVRADYCGDGWSYTHEGTPIGIADQLGVNDPSPELSSLDTGFFEAVWRTDGADCVNYIRTDGWGNLHCGRPTCDQLDPGGSYGYFEANDGSLLSWR